MYASHKSWLDKVHNDYKSAKYDEQKPAAFRPFISNDMPSDVKYPFVSNDLSLAPKPPPPSPVVYHAATDKKRSRSDEEDEED
jgi:hypothetical protein